MSPSFTILHILKAKKSFDLIFLGNIGLGMTEDTNGRMQMTRRENTFVQCHKNATTLFFQLFTNL